MKRFVIVGVLALFSVSWASAQLRPSYYDAASLPQASPRTVTGEDVPQVNATGCPLFVHTLFWGVTDTDTNGEVTRLRRFLGLKEPKDKEEGGVFTEEVELAVRDLQKRHGLVTPGLSCKTGYGIVERRTREYINEKNDCTPVIPRKTVSCAGVARCPILRTNAVRGTSDAEGVRGVVSTMQCFLRTQGIFTGSVNGMFGSATEDAVRRFQTSRKLSVSGTLNAQTREAIAQCSPVLVEESGKRAKSHHYTIRIDPSRGKAPLIVTMTFAFNGTTCSSYELQWGDGTIADSFDAGRPATCTQKPVTQTYTKTFTRPGVYDVSVKQGDDALSRLPVSNSAQVIVE